MPIDFQGVNPTAISYGGQSVKRVTYNGTEVWFELPKVDSLENMSWADISVVCRAGAASRYWQLGETKRATIGSTEYEFRVIGIDHDSVTDAASYGRAKAGLSLQMTKQFAASVMHEENMSASVWYHTNAQYDSYIRRVRLPAVYNQMPWELQRVIVDVEKEYTTSRTTTEVRTVTSTLWIPSYNEVFGGDGDLGYQHEGSRYAYFANRAPEGWGSNCWTRTCAPSSAMFYYVNTSGAAASTFVISAGNGYTPCFCV